MYLKSLFLRNFRSYSETLIHFSPKINVIIGKNGQGKTNLLEAIHLLSWGRSFRTPRLQELIQKGKTFFYLEAIIEKNGITETLKFYYTPEEKKIEHNATVYPSFTPLLGSIPSVLHTPHDGHLIMGSPEIRRKFFNLHLSQYDPLYLDHWNRFYKAMKQRNILLKNNDITTIGCWEEGMAASFSYLFLKRKEMTLQLQELLASMSLPDRLTLTFSPSFPQKEGYLSHLQKTRAKDLLYASTLTGPHRDELSISINDLSAKSYGSEGQKDFALFAIKVGEWQRLLQKTNTFPLMGIDDFGVHLDTIRLKLLQQELQRFSQVFITAPFPILEHHPDALHITLEEGEVSRP